MLFRIVVWLRCRILMEKNIYIAKELFFLSIYNLIILARELVNKNPSIQVLFFFSHPLNNFVKMMNNPNSILSRSCIEMVFKLHFKQIISKAPAKTWNPSCTFPEYKSFTRISNIVLILHSTNTYVKHCTKHNLYPVWKKYFINVSQNKTKPTSVHKATESWIEIRGRTGNSPSGIRVIYLATFLDLEVGSRPVPPSKNILPWVALRSFERLLFP